MPEMRRAGLHDVAALTVLQHSAYARNRDILGVEPLPLMADYADVLVRYEGWLIDGAGALDGALILAPRADDLLIWSVATAPAAQGRGLGRRMLSHAELRAAQLGQRTLRLYTGEKLTGNVAWYQRRGYAIERVEARADRNIVHMVKHLGQETPGWQDV